MAQFVAHVRARVQPEERELARRTLPAAAFDLFERMPVADRRHGLDVAERLLAGGIEDRDVLAAALLHDAAKGDRMRLWHRVAGVLLEALAPRVLRRLADAEPESSGHPFHLYLNHGLMSAELALDAGCSPRTADFIRGTTDQSDARLLRALKAADDAS